METVAGVVRGKLVVTRQATGSATGRAQTSGVGYATPPDPLRSQVVLHLPFDGTEGSTVFTDVSPMANSVVLADPGPAAPFITQTGTHFGSGMLRSASNYLAAHSYLVVGPRPVASHLRLDQSDFTVEMRVSFPAVPFNSDICTLFSLGYTTNTPSSSVFTGLRIWTANGYINVDASSGPGAFLRTSAQYATGAGLGLQPMQLAVTWERATNTFRIFINGVQFNDRSFDPLLTFTIPNNAYALILGDHEFNSGVERILPSSAVVHLDELRITRALRTTFDITHPLPAY